MSQSETIERPVITVSEQAATVFKAACAKSAPESVILFSVRMQGDSLAHVITIAERTRPGDVVFTQHGVTMAVSEEQVPILQGTEVDYRQDADGGAFVVSNPNTGSGKQ
jgi:iron-sulfur cluster assembly protein